MIDILDTLFETARKESHKYTPEVFTLRGLWNTSYILRLNDRATLFHLRYMLAQTIGQGCSYYDPSMEEPGLSETFLGRNILEIATENRCLKVAMLDAAFCSMHRGTPSKQHVLDGNNVDKADQRAEIICEEILSWLKRQNRKKGRNLKIANVGVVGNILSILNSHKDVELTASDYYAGIVGKSVHGTYVEHGGKTPELIAEADLALVTGMTLANDTLDDILDTALESKTALAIFAETGAHFAQEYCRMGVEIVFSEPFPFYLSCPGRTQIDVYERG